MPLATSAGSGGPLNTTSLGTFQNSGPSAGWSERGGAAGAPLAAGSATADGAAVSGAGGCVPTVAGCGGAAAGTQPLASVRAAKASELSERVMGITFQRDRGRPQK